MEPEPSIANLLLAINALATQVRSLQDQVKSQGEQITQLLSICKETNNIVGDKDQGGQARPGTMAGPSTPPDQQGGPANSPGTVRPKGLSNPFQPTRSMVGYNSKEEDPRWEIKREPCRASQGLSSFTPFDEGTGTKHPKMELPNPYKGDTRGCKATQWLNCMLLWVALHQNQFNKEEQMVVWILYHMEDKADDWALPLINNIIKGKGSTPKTIKALGL